MNLIKLLRTSAHAKLPTRGTLGSAYCDLYAAEHILLDPGCFKRITTGWCIAVPEGFFLDIRPRSGLACSGITINNAPGTVDADYRGELRVVLVNHGHFPYRIEIGDRIAQCALMPVVATAFAEVNELTPTTRGQKGFGSTG